MATSAIERLRRHAGLAPADGSPDRSVSQATHDGNPAEVEAATSDCVEALDLFNRDLNGPLPSSPVGAQADSVSRGVAYAVAEVARMLRDAGADRSARKVETAWLAVLAGDVDDVREHVAEEEIARGE